MKIHQILLLLFSIFGVSGVSQAAPPTFDVRHHGATGEGKRLDTAHIQKAIDACADAGGGRVLFPEGTYLTGSLELKSGVRLVLTPKAVLMGSSNLKHYPKRKLIYAADATDITIEGGGTIDGQGHLFWKKRDKSYSGPMYRGTAQFNYEPLPRPSFLYFQRCRDVTLRNITLKNSPAWTVHLLRCRDAMMERLTIRNPLHGPNTDGIDINSSIDVVVRDCDIVTGDDGVVLKSTEPGHDHPSRNITVEGCRIWSACNCLKIGTETHDHFENIRFRNCHLYAGSDNTLERPLSGVAIESVDGAHLSNIRVTDITMDHVRAPIFVRLGHRAGKRGHRQVEPRVPGQIKDVVIRGVVSKDSLFESSITGIPSRCVKEITLENLQLEYEGGGNEEWVLAEVPDEAKVRGYPEAQMFGRLPAYGLYCRHVNGIRLKNVAISCLNPDPRPMLVCDNVVNLTADTVNAASVHSALPVFWLLNTRQAVIRDCTAPPETKTFVAVESSDQIELESNDTSNAEIPLAELETGELVEQNVPLFSETSPGLVEIEAEAMRLLDPMTARVDSEQPSGKYITVDLSHSRDRGSALCRFQISRPAEYEIWVRAFGGSGESNSFYTAIDRGPLALTDVTELKRWHWLKVHHREETNGTTRTQKTYDLKAGIHTFQLRNRESGTRIDAVVLVRTSEEFTPRNPEGP
ncbi:MAG: glycosyl hydrolase family 28 protein [Pirellulaceae bacterium]